MFANYVKVGTNVILVVVVVVVIAENCACRSEHKIIDQGKGNMFVCVEPI